MRARWRSRASRVLYVCMVASMLMIPTGYAQVDEPSPPSETPPLTGEGPPDVLEEGYSLSSPGSAGLPPGAQPGIAPAQVPR